MMICIKRTQDIDGDNDPYCIACWNCGDYDYQPANYYTDREDCMTEFCVTEEEFDKICSTNLNTLLPLTAISF